VFCAFGETNEKGGSQYKDFKRGRKADQEVRGLMERGTPFEANTHLGQG